MEREAGPALDGLLAQVAFGQTVETMGGSIDPESGYFFVCEACQYAVGSAEYRARMDELEWDGPRSYRFDHEHQEERPCYLDAPHDHWAAVPAYSTTGDGMLLVIERMRALGWSVEMSMWDGVDKVPFPAWAKFAPVSVMVRRSLNGGTNADTLPHAVALAALAAMGGMGGGDG